MNFILFFFSLFLSLDTPKLEEETRRLLKMDMKYEYVCLVSATVLLFDIFYCTFWLLDINKTLKSTNKTKAMLNIENLFKYSIDVKSLV